MNSAADAHNSDLPATIDEAIDVMADSDNVTLRMQGVLAAFLHEKYQVPKQQGFNDGRALIKKLNTAGLATFIREDLDRFITEAKKDRA